MKKENCHRCKGEFELNQLFSYVDGNNIAITRNSPDYCLDCYKKIYGEK